MKTKCGVGYNSKRGGGCCRYSLYSVIAIAGKTENNKDIKLKII